MKINDAQRAEIDAAITRAESGTDGEVMLIMAKSSDPYHDIALWWALLSMLLGLALLASFPDLYMATIDRVAGGWTHVWTPRELLTIALITGVVEFLAVRLLLNWRPLRLALTPRAIRRRRVRRRAIDLFRASTERRTLSRTGVLLYISDAEHQAEIVADETIHARIPAERWGDAMAVLVEALREGRPAEGIIAATAMIGALLADVLPRTGSDPDELPNRLILL